MLNRYYKAILDNSPESIVMLGLNHEVLAFNRVMSEVLFEYHQRKIQEGDLYYPDFVIEDAKELYLQGFGKALTGQEFMVRHNTKLGELDQWFEYRMLPVFDDEELIGITLSAKNITKEIRAEIKLREQSNRMRAILDNTEISITLLDVNHKILALNRVSEESIRYNSPLENYIGRDFRDYLPDKTNLYYEYFPKAISGESCAAEIPYTNALGELIWYSTKFNPVYNENGTELIGVSIFAKDVTKQKQMEILIKESETKFRGIVEQSQVGIFILQNEKLIYVNPGFESIFGYTQEELLRENSYDHLIHPDHLDLVTLTYDKFINGEIEKEQYEFEIVNATGSIRHVEAVVSLISYNSQPAIIGTLIDITNKIDEEKRINEAVLNAQEKERLQIGMELHDIVKQILAGTSLFLELAEERIEDRAFISKVLSDLKQYNNEAILELRRLSHQLAPLVEEGTVLSEKIEWLIESLKLNESINVELNIESSNDNLDNKIQLAFYRILQEQLSNILKYARASKVDISVYQKKNRVSLFIKDNGVGFDLGKRKEGIGLENIRRRAQMLNGKSEIFSEPGKGCELRIVVPIT